MTIMEALGGRCGETITEVLGGKKGQTIADRIIEKAEENNPLKDLAVDFEIGALVDLFGKVVSDLQEDMAVSNKAFTGTSKYVTGYTGFSGKEDEQQGNYIAFHCSVPDMTIGQDGLSIKVNGSTLDSDGIIVLIMKSHTKPITVTATKGEYTKTLKIDPSGVTYEAPAVEEEVETPVE